MKEKHKLFAEHYAIDQNATKAATSAGYSLRSAGTQGARLMANEGIKAYIDQLLGKVKEKCKLSHEYLIERLKSLAETNREKNPSVAVRCYELLGKHIGTFEPKVSDLEERPAFVGISINFGPGGGVKKIMKNGGLVESNDKKLPPAVTPAIDVKSKALN